MAGIGEASAIVGVAQLGFSLAKTLNTLIGDYKDARQTLTRMGAEIESTSLAMERLGDLAKKGRLYGSKGVLEAAGLANRYSDAIIEIRVMLKKKNKPMNPTTVSSDEIELSCFEKIRFAFLKPRLEISQLEVSRIKADLTLTYLSLIALTGDTDAEKNQALSEIPSWTRTLKWANLEFEKAVARQHNNTAGPEPLIGLQALPPPYAVPSHGPGPRHSRQTQSSLIQDHGRYSHHKQGSVIQDDVSAEHLKQYIKWAENKHAEAQRKAEELRLQALQLEKMKRQEEEEAREKLIAEKAIKQYEEMKRLEAAELAYKQQERDHDLRQRLQAANVAEEEIDRIMHNAPLMLTGPRQDMNAGVPHTLAAPNDPVGLISQDNGGHNHNPVHRQHAAGVQNQRKRYSQPLSTPSRLKPAQNVEKPLERPVLEAWCIDQGSQSRFCTPLAEDWLDDFIASKAYKKSSQLMWERYAQLHLWYRKQINDVFEEKQRDAKHKWSMISLHQSKPTRSPFLLRRPSKESLVQMILVRVPFHSDQKYKTWLNEGEDGGRILPILPSAPLPSPRRPNLELYVNQGVANDIRDPETVQSTGDPSDRSDATPAERSPARKQATVIIEVFMIDSGYSTILPIDTVDASSLMDGGYEYIETGTDYVIQELVKGSELDTLIDQKYQSIAVIIYDQDFQSMQAAERTSARRYIKQQNFPASNLIRGRFLRFRFVKSDEIGFNGLRGDFVRESLEGMNTPHKRAEHLPLRQEMLTGRHASLARHKETRFDMERNRSYVLPSSRERENSFDDYEPVRLPSPVHDYGYPQSSRQIVHPSRFTPAAYGPPAPIIIHNPIRNDDYVMERDWTVGPRESLSRQRSRHMAPSGPQRRGSYEFEADQRSRYPQPRETAITNHFVPGRHRSRSHLHEPDASMRRRRSRSRGSFTDGSYEGFAMRGGNKDSQHYETRERDRFDEIRLRRSRTPPLEDDPYGDVTIIRGAHTRGQRSLSPVYREREYISLRPPRPYGFQGVPMEDVDDGEQEFQSDKDITAMQLAKITGGMPSTMGTTTEFTATKTAEEQKPKAPDYEAEKVGPYRERSTYVEDTVDDDDIANKPIEDRIYEIHEEPEPLFVEVEEEITQRQQPGEPSKGFEASAWNFWSDGKNAGHATTAAPTGNEGNKDHQWNWSTPAKFKAVADDDWGASWGTTSKDKKKKKKKTDKTPAVSANSREQGGEFSGEDEIPTKGSFRRSVRASRAKDDIITEESDRERRSRSEVNTGRAAGDAVVRRRGMSTTDDEKDTGKAAENNTVVRHRRRGSDSTDDEKNWSWASDQKDHYDDWDKRKNKGK